VELVDKEVSSLADLSEGDILRGYVVSAGSVGVLVRLATQPAVGSFFGNSFFLAVQHFSNVSGGL